MKTIAILGAAGGVGTALARHCARSTPYHITALAAPWDSEERRVALRRLGIKLFVGDIRNTNDLQQCMARAHAVVNCAAMLPGNEDKKAQYDINVRANERILRLAKSIGTEKIVFLSTAGVATHHHRVNDERAPYRKPPNAHVWSKIECERMLDRVAQEIRRPCVILRPVSIYGPSMMFRWPETIRYVKNGNMALIGAGTARYPLIYEDDLARAIVCAIETDRLHSVAQNEKIIISADEPTTVGDITRLLARFLGAPPPKHRPYALALLASYCATAIPRRIKSERLKLLTPHTVKEYAFGHRYDTEKAKKLLGFSARVPLYDGIQHMLAAYGELPCAR